MRSCCFFGYELSHENKVDRIQSAVRIEVACLPVYDTAVLFAEDEIVQSHEVGDIEFAVTVNVNDLLLFSLLDKNRVVYRIAALTVCSERYGLSGRKVL